MEILEEEYQKIIESFPNAIIVDNYISHLKIPLVNNRVLDIDYKKYPKVKDKLVKIQDINENLGSTSTEGKVMNRFPVKEFTRKDGQIGRVSSIILRDSTGKIRITFWNDDIEKIENIEVGDFIALTNLNPKKSNFAENKTDVHASSWTKITKKDKELKIEEKIIDKIEKLQQEKDFASFKGVITTIDDLKQTGVDLLEGAIEISKLRLWLWLVSDYAEGKAVVLLTN